MAQEGQQVVEEIVVTGSRITRTEFTAPTPLQIFDAAEIEAAAETNIGEFLNQLPAVGEPGLTRTGTGFSVASSGQTSVDLRDLNSTRTLTLVNGRRHVAGVPGSSAVDFNAIPSALVERVEIITGGAAAVYGSDAVAGVVNFIYKTDFEGLDFRTRYGATTEHGDDQDTDISLLVGSNFDDDRGNAVLFVGYTDQGAVRSRDRKRTRLDAVANRNDPLGPRNLPTCSSGPPQGRFDVDGSRSGGTSNHWTYDPDGNLRDSFDASDPGADDCEDGFNRSYYRTIAIPTERKLLGSNVHWNLNDSTRLFVEGTWISTTTDAVIEPFFLNVEDAYPSLDPAVDPHGMPLFYANSTGTMISNPFIPEQVLAAANASIAARQMAYDEAVAHNMMVMQGAMDDEGNPLMMMDLPDLHSGYIGIVRRLVEFGPRTAESERRTARIVVGFDGEFRGWDWDVSLNYGQTTQEQISGGRIDLGALRHALAAEEDPAGGYRCIDPVARAQGCVPIDLFGGVGSIGPVETARGMRDPRTYITADNSVLAKIKQRIVQGNITGDLFELRSGPVGVAFGFELRKEKSQDDRDPLTSRGLSSSNAIPSVRGEFDVTEYYAEINIPLWSGDAPFHLDFGAAGRFSDYSSVGDVTSYEARLELTPMPHSLPELKLRLAHARPVRAPNIDELFAAAGETFAQVNDPCIGVELTGDNPNIHDNVEANCRAHEGVVRRINNPVPDPATEGAGFRITQAELQGTSGLVGEGNMNLIEETGITTTAGFTYDFSLGWADAFVAMDWFDIEVEDAIQSVSQNNTVRLCYESENLSDSLCDNITRFASTGALQQVNTQVINSALLTTAGIDTLVNLNLTDRDISISFSYTWLDEYNLVPLPGQDVDMDAGEIGNAEHRWNGTAVWRPNDDWVFQGQVRYIAESRLDDNSHSDAACAGYDHGCEVDAVYYTDLRATYRGYEGAEFFFGLENAFDQEPPVLSAGLAGAGSDTGTETNADVYDAIGRAWYIGLKVNL